MIPFQILRRASDNYDLGFGVVRFNVPLGLRLNQFMIPKIIHQTWKTNSPPPAFRAFANSWQTLNPGWEYKFWSDRDLLEFVSLTYPELLELFCSYQRGVERSDAGRYLLLHHFGGVYADLDAECVQSLEPLISENRLILSREPDSLNTHAARCRGMPTVLFNGVIASPKGHPFWPHLLRRMADCRHASSVLDSTGPYLLTGSVLSYPVPEELLIEDENFFNPKSPIYKQPQKPAPSPCYAIHHLAGTWWKTPRPNWRERVRNLLTIRYHQARVTLGGRSAPPAQTFRARVSPAALAAPLPSGKNVAILVPVRDASQHLPGFLAAIEKLDLPKSQIKLVFCEGDSSDDTFARLEQLTAPLKPLYRDIVLLRHHTGSKFEHSLRWLPALQRSRRSALAKVRNHLIQQGLNETDNWALWIDVDVWKFPTDILSQLFATRARIVTPNCVLKPGGRSYDLNNFKSIATHRDFSLIRDGIFQPPANYPFRLWLSDMRHSDRVPLDAVGGTMLLVDAALHRGGMIFPEEPYDYLIETEGFGRLASHCGITPIGLPRVEIFHVPW